MAGLDPLVPFTTAGWAQQIRQYDQNILNGGSVLPAIATPSAKALQAEINCAAALKNPAYTRP